MGKRLATQVCVLALLLTLLPGCTPVPYDAHAQAIDDALQSAYDDAPDAFLYIDLGEGLSDQLRAQSKQEQKDVWNYQIEAALPALDAIAPGEIAVALPEPTIPWDDVTAVDAGDVIIAFENAYCAQLMQALRAGSASNGEAFTLDVTVVPHGDAFVATIANIDDVRSALAGPLETLLLRELLACESYGLLEAVLLVPECASDAFQSLPIASQVHIEDVAREQGTVYRVTLSYPNIADVYRLAGDDLIATYDEPFFNRMPDAFSLPAFDKAVAQYAAQAGASSLSSFTVDIADAMNNTFADIGDAAVQAATAAKADIARRINDAFYVAVGHDAHYTESSFAEAFGAKPTSYVPEHPVDGVVTIVKKDDSKADWTELDETIGDLFAMCEPALLPSDDARFASVLLTYTIKHPSAGKYKTKTYTFTAYNTELTLTAYDLRKKKQIASATFGTYYGSSIEFNESWLDISDSGARSLRAVQPTIDTADATSKSGKKAKAFVDAIAGTRAK